MEVFREVLIQAGKIIDSELAILGRTGLILASTDKEIEGQFDESVLDMKFGKDICTYVNDKIYGKITVRNRIEYYGYIKGQTPEHEKLLRLLLINIQNLRKYHKEKFSKENFIQSLIFGKVSISDIGLRAKELHIDYNKPRQLYLISSKDSGDAFIQETLRGLFPDRDRDFLVTIDNKNIVLIKDLSEGEKNKGRIASTILDTLNSETMTDINIYIASIANNLEELMQAYLDACKAKEIGTIFEGERHIVDFNNLGLGRLIYELPRELCEIFISEVFNEDSYSELDGETIKTIIKFFENNLNISETSRQLYVHRNTLVYRLDKIQKVTGLDLRNFDDAIIFKISMMVKRYLDKT